MQAGETHNLPQIIITQRFRRRGKRLDSIWSFYIWYGLGWRAPLGVRFRSSRRIATVFKGH